MRLTTFMLADGARTGTDGKLYVFGGQWDRVFAPMVPTTQVMALALVFEIDYNEALKEHQLDIYFRREDGELVGPRAMAKMAVGHPVGLKPGGSVYVPMAIDQQVIPLGTYGGYEWIVEVDAEILGHLPLHVVPVPTPFLPPPAAQ